MYYHLDIILVGSDTGSVGYDNIVLTLLIAEIWDSTGIAISPLLYILSNKKVLKRKMKSLQDVSKRVSSLAYLSH